MGRSDHWPDGAGQEARDHVATDLRNGGVLGVGDGVAEAAKAIGWDFRISTDKDPSPAAPPR